MDAGKQEALRFLHNSLLLEAILQAAREGKLSGQAEERDEADEEDDVAA